MAISETKWESNVYKAKQSLFAYIGSILACPSILLTERDFETCGKTIKRNDREGHGRYICFMLCVLWVHIPLLSKWSPPLHLLHSALCPFPYYKHFIIQAPATFSLFSFLTPSLFILTLQVPRPHPPWHTNKYSSFFLLVPPFSSNTSLTDPQPPLLFFWFLLFSSSIIHPFLFISPYLIPLAFLNLFRSSIFPSFSLLYFVISVTVNLAILLLQLLP